MNMRLATKPSTKIRICRLFLNVNICFLGRFSERKRSQEDTRFTQESHPCHIAFGGNDIVWSLILLDWSTQSKGLLCKSVKTENRMVHSVFITARKRRVLPHGPGLAWPLDTAPKGRPVERKPS